MASGSGRARIVEQAEKYVKAGKLKEAVAEYEKLVDAQTPDIGSSNIVGDLYARLDQTDKAVKAFQDVAAEYEKKGLNSQALAIYKKITKLRPSNIDFTTKLAELFSVQGFVSDAKREYGKVADELLKSQKPLEAIQIYEKIIRLDADDLEAKRTLVDLYKGSDLADAAVEMLNDIAAARIEKGQLEDAEGLLSEARDLKPSYPRTLAGLVTIYKNRNEKDR
ncbi:MAG: tetratricopeptide repeat protein, partial [Acidobacteriota bacterium]|nr:tetratricopeptide repeat protein [Acidobacteriota bacterium]